MNPIYARFNEIGNIAIAGDTGAGKTNTALFFASQIALAGGRIIVCDPHGNAPEESQQQTLAHNIAPLAPSFMCDVCIEDDDINDAIQLANDILRSRRSGSSAKHPVWLIIDEFSGVMRNNTTAAAMTALLEDIATEGRKFFVGVILMGTQWHVSRSGGGELRSVINAAVLHKMKRENANRLVNLGRHLPDTWTLRTGEAYLYWRDIVKIRIPRVTQQDMMQVARMVAGPAGIAYLPGRDDKQEINTVSTDQNAEKRDPAKRRIVELFEQGMDISEVARQVFSVRSGPPYQRALAEVNQVLREEYIK